MNRRVGIAAVLLLATILGQAALTPVRAGAASGTADQAVAYQINVAHSGYLSGDTLAPPLVKQWSRTDLGGTVSYPLIAGGKVFVTVAGPYTSTTGSYPPKWVYALDETTGATIWSQQISGTYSFVNAAYDNGMVYVLNYDGLLQTFNADTGTPGWSANMSGQYSFTSPPTAANGVIYIAGEGSGGTVYAVNESNGAINWQLSRLDTGGHSSPTLSSGNVFVSGSCDVYAFYRTVPTGGSPLMWDKNYGCTGGGGKTSVLGFNSLYVRQVGVPASNDILNPNGAVTGHFSAGPAPAFSPTYGFFLNGQMLQATDPKGNVVWSFSGDGGLDTAPIVVNSDVYVGSSTGMVYAVDASTGQSVWSTNVGASIQGPDEQNATLTTGLGAGEGHLLVPAGSTLTAFTAQNPDTTPPAISSTVNGPQGSNGWYTGATTVTWAVTDPESGVVSSSGCGSTTLSSDTAGTTLTCTATNGAGLTSSSSVTVMIDGTAPAIACSSPPAGWSASDVSINCQSNDTVSHLANSSDLSFSLSTSVPSGTETSSASTSSRTVCDSAGNCATAGPYTGLKIDKKAPSITLTSPTTSTYTLNQSVVASYTCSDGGSGVASCSGSVPGGQPIDTASVGTKTFTVNAADQVGNAASPASAGYTVQYGVCQSSIPSAKSGHAVNVGVQLCDASSKNVSSAAVTLTASAIVNSSGAQVQTMNNTFTYTSSLNNNGGGYMDKVDTTGLSTGTYYVVFTAGGDPTSHRAAFSVK